MKRRVFLLFILLISLFSSCEKEVFSLSSITFEKETVVWIFDSTVKKEELLIKFDVSERKDSYTFIMYSPSQDLKWEGFAVSDESGALCAKAELNPGAVFEEGEYSITLYSSNGTEVRESVTLERAEEAWPVVTEEGLSLSSYVDEYDGEGNLIDSGARERLYTPSENTAYVVMKLNNVKVVQSLVQSPDETS